MQRALDVLIKIVIPSSLAPSGTSKKIFPKTKLFNLIKVAYYQKPLLKRLADKDGLLKSILVSTSI